MSRSPHFSHHTPPRQPKFSTRALLCTLLMAFSGSSFSQQPASEQPGTGQESNTRNIPYQDAFGPDSPPETPLPPGQTPLEPWVRAALGVLYQRPSPPLGQSRSTWKSPGAYG